MAIKVINTDAQRRELSFFIARPVAVASASLRRGTRMSPVLVKKSVPADITQMFGCDDDQALRWLMGSTDVLKLLKSNSIVIHDSRVPEVVEPEVVLPAQVALSAPQAEQPNTSEVREERAELAELTTLAAVATGAIPVVEIPSMEWTLESLQRWCAERKIDFVGKSKPALLRAIRTAGG